MVAVTGIGFQSSTPPAEKSLIPEGFAAGFTLPVPAGARAIARSIEPGRWRSLLVIDLDPVNAADWTDTVVLLRMKPIPGVLMARSSVPCEFPHPFEGSQAWWAFANGIDVKVTSHTSVLDAVASAVVSMAFENPAPVLRQVRRDPHDRMETDTVFTGSARVEVSGDR